MNPTPSQSRIAVDAMGGDLGPAEVVEAIRLALKKVRNLDPILLFGKEETLHPLLRQAGLEGHPRVILRHAPGVVSMDDKPLIAIKKKKDSSMMQAIDGVKNGEARVLVSCGNTGSLMAGGTLRLRTMDGIDRPALAAIIPRRHGHFVMLDVGANPESKVEHLVHNAVLGSHYCRVVLGIDKPRVGLLTIGIEEGKGNEAINQTHEQLRRLGDLINYSGRLEGFQVFEGMADVALCDGFTGNILLKSWESLVSYLKDSLKDQLLKNPWRQLGALLAQGAFQTVKRQINPDHYGGAPLLGLRANILKAHGSSNRYAIQNAIRVANEIIHHDMNHLIEADIARANDLMHSPVV